MKIPRKIFSELTEIILEGGAIKATKYYDNQTVVTATRKLFGGKIYKRDRRIEILFKIGKPNYAEMEFIKKCKKAKEPFPIKKIQIKWLKN
jgi:hypothetical protein